MESTLTPRIDAPSSVPVPAKPAVVEPLSATRYAIRFTASAELNEKLKRLRSLMRSSVPDGDLASLIEEAVTEKLEQLEARRFGKSSKPRKSLEQTDTTPRSRHIPAAVRRAVYERDGGQCTFLDKRGRRCTAHDGLEFDHQRAYGRGGDHSVANVHLACKAHNQYRADREYGHEKMRRYRDGVAEPAAGYATNLDHHAATERGRLELLDISSARAHLLSHAGLSMQCQRLLGLNSGNNDDPERRSERLHSSRTHRGRPEPQTTGVDKRWLG